MTEVFTIKESNIDLLKLTQEISGEVITLCEQCGICTTSCPVAEEMDYSPSNIMRMVQIGDHDILESRAIWFCASCFSCTVRCPRGIDLAKVNEALRQIKLRKNVDYLDIDHMDVEEVEELPAIALVSALRKYTG